MPNAAVSQATATAHFDRWLQADRKALQLFDLLELYRTSKVYVRQDGGLTSTGVRQITEWNLTGIKLSESGRNTDADGRLWARIAANGGNWDILLYKAKTAQAGDKVAEALNVAAGATFTLVAANSSGIGGTARLGASPAAIAADTYAIQCYLGWNEADRQLLDGTQQEDGEILAAHQIVNALIVRALEGLLRSLNQLNQGAAHLKQMARIWQIPHNIGFLDKRTSVDDDVVSVLVDGAFERLRQNWKDNTTVQKVPETTLSPSAVTEANPSGGDVAVVVGTIGENIEPGRVQAVVVEDELPNQRYEITFTPDDGTGPITGRNRLTVGKVWDDPDIPIQLTVTNAFTKNWADTQIAPIGDLAGVTGATRDNSDDGKWYGKVVQSGSNWIYEFYSDSNRTKLVAKSPAVAAGAAFTATQQNRSALTISWKAGSAPTNGSTGDFDMNPVKKGNSTTPPDQFTFTISRTAKGRIQDAAREFHAWKLHQAASPTFADTLIDKNGRFIDGNP